jgi:GMP synthase (glutamine-hydrolysing)
MRFNTIQKFSLHRRVKNARKFFSKIAEVPQNFTPNAFVEDMVAELKEKLQDDKVVLGLSGGVDSTVAAVLLHQAIGKIYTVFCKQWFAS